MRLSSICIAFAVALCSFVCATHAQWEVQPLGDFNTTKVNLYPYTSCQAGSVGFAAFRGEYTEPRNSDGIYRVTPSLSLVLPIPEGRIEDLKCYPVGPGKSLLWLPHGGLIPYDGAEMFLSDGTRSGTVPVRLPPGKYAAHITSWNGAVYLLDYDGGLFRVEANGSMTSLIPGFGLPYGYIILADWSTPGFISFYGSSTSAIPGSDTIYEVDLSALRRYVVPKFPRSSRYLRVGGRQFFLSELSSPISDLYVADGAGGFSLVGRSLYLTDYGEEGIGGPNWSDGPYPRSPYPAVRVVQSRLFWIDQDLNVWVVEGSSIAPRFVGRLPKNGILGASLNDGFFFGNDDDEAFFVSPRGIVSIGKVPDMASRTFQGAVYFIDSEDKAIVRSDGTLAGTTSGFLPIKGWPTQVGDKLILTSLEGAVGKTYDISGPSIAAFPLVDAESTVTSSSFPVVLGTVNNKVLFFTQAPSSESRLFATDGTAQGTVSLWKEPWLVKGYASIVARTPGRAVIEGRWESRQSNGSVWRWWEYYLTDGTQAGTSSILQRTSTEPKQADEYSFLGLSESNKAFFQTRLDSNRRIVFQDLTTKKWAFLPFSLPEGATAVKPAEALGSVVTFVVMRDAYLSGTVWAPAFDLWRTDGTESGTFQVAQFANKRLVSTRKENGRVVLDVERYDGQYGLRQPERWVSDGTPGGTTTVPLSGEYLARLDQENQKSSVVLINSSTGAQRVVLGEGTDLRYQGNFTEFRQLPTGSYFIVGERKYANPSSAIYRLSEDRSRMDKLTQSGNGVYAVSDEGKLVFGDVCGVQKRACLRSPEGLSGIVTTDTLLPALAGFDFYGGAAFAGENLLFSMYDSIGFEPYLLRRAAVTVPATPSPAPTPTKPPTPAADLCPTDPAKTAPGVCGCGVSDSDMNGNGAPDCQDPALATLKLAAPKISYNRRSKQVTIAAAAVTTGASSSVTYRFSYEVRRPGKRKGVRGTMKSSVATAALPTSMSQSLRRGSMVIAKYKVFLVGAPLVSTSDSPSATYKIP